MVFDVKYADVEIFILSYNRYEMVVSAIESALNQSYLKCKIIVSENSTDPSVYDGLSCRFNNIEIRNRVPSLKPVDHFNLVLSEVSTEFFCIFHDDDIMLPNFVSQSVSALQSNTNLVAVASNAFLNSTQNTIFKTNQDLTITSQKRLAEYYLSLYLNPAPFPGYFYRSELITGITFNGEEAGKHGDATFLINILARGSIMWLSISAMRYNLHDDQDSASESIVDRKKFYKFINRYQVDRRLLTLFRIYIAYKILSKKKISKMRLTKLRYLILLFLLKHPLFSIKVLAGKLLT